MGLTMAIVAVISATICHSVNAGCGGADHRSVSVARQLCCQSRRQRPGERTRAHNAQTTGATTMQTDAHNDMSREERRALLEQRRADVARQLRRLVKELADLDRQLDEIEQWDR